MTHAAGAAVVCLCWAAAGQQGWGAKAERGSPAALGGHLLRVIQEGGSLRALSPLPCRQHGPCAVGAGGSCGCKGSSLPCGHPKWECGKRRKRPAGVARGRNAQKTPRNTRARQTPVRSVTRILVVRLLGLRPCPAPRIPRRTGRGLEGLQPSRGEQGGVRPAARSQNYPFTRGREMRGALSCLGAHPVCFRSPLCWAKSVP